MSEKGSVSIESVRHRQANRKYTAQAVDMGIAASHIYNMDDPVGRDRWYSSPNRNDIYGLDVLPPKGWKPPPRTPSPKTQTYPKPSTKPSKIDSSGYEFSSDMERIRGILQPALENFTPSERKIIKKNVEFGSRRGADSAGTFLYIPDNPNQKGEIRISGVMRKEAAEATMTHELIHALRAYHPGRKGKYTKRPGYILSRGERDQEEAQTTAETTARFKKSKFDTESMRNHPSYYYQINNPGFDINRNEDKKLLTGRHEHFVGNRAIKAIEDLFTQTHIAKLSRQNKIKGKSENIDMFFKVTDKKNRPLGTAHFYDGRNPTRRNHITSDKAARELDALDGILGNNNIYQYTDKGKLRKVRTVKRR